MLMRLGLMMIFLSLIACNEKASVAKTPIKENKGEQELSDLDWMLGKWKREDTGELALWSKREESYFGGMMVKVNQQEKAVIQEVLSLEGRKDGIYFSSKEKGQNNSRRFEYKMTNKNFNAPKFTCPEKDFPKHISYVRIGSDKIKVEEIGTSGQEKFYYFIREI